MRVQVPHDAQTTGDLRVAGFFASVPPVCFPVFAVTRQISSRCRAPPDLQPPRGLPARSPSAPRASLGASSRSPARPRRPRGGLQSGGLSRYFPSLSQASTPHAIQNSPSTRTTPVSQPYFRAVAARVLSAQRSSWESPACDVTTPDRAVKPKLSSQETM